MRRNISKNSVRIIAALTATTMAATPVLAAGWQKNATGWWYGTNAANTTWHSNGWQWIDGNGDGTAECYYFGPDGYMYSGRTTPDGYTVNADGAWTANGSVQTKAVATGSTGPVVNDAQNGAWQHGTGAYAGRWQWKNNDGSFRKSGWFWLDGNRDGIAECYYFDADGYLAAGTVTPDGYTVNADGAWVENNTVKTKQVSGTTVSAGSGSYRSAGGGSGSGSGSSGGGSGSSGSSSRSSGSRSGSSSSGSSSGSSTSNSSGSSASGSGSTGSSSSAANSGSTGNTNSADAAGSASGTNSAASNLPKMSDSATPDNMLALTSAYDKDGYYILNKAKSDGETLAEYIDSDDNILGVLDTTVHEMLHSIDNTSFNTSSGKYKHSYYAGNGEMTTVEYADPWDSAEMADTLPEACKVFRWSTYINTTDNMSSNIFGIYGILEEFTAYSFGMNTSVKMLDFFKNNAKTTDEWNNYVVRCENGKQAWAEFMSFMAAYLKYSEEHYPETYSSIINNTAFKTQVHKANTVFLNAISSYNKSLSVLKDVLEDNGYTINVGSDRIEYAYTEGRTTHHGSISRFTQNYDNIVSELKSAELSPYYNMLMNW